MKTKQTYARCLRHLLATLGLVASMIACGADASTSGTAKKKPEAKEVVPNAAVPASLFAEWFAVGSGCRATREAAGDVVFEPIGIEAGKPNAIRGRFLMKDYKLSSPPSNPATSIAFARECNVRIKVKPPAGKRVKGVNATATWSFAKDAPVRLQLQNTLYMDTTLVGAVFDDVPVGEAVPAREKDVALANGRFVNVPEQPPLEKPYECGADLVFGSDFTIIAHRKEKSDKAEVKLGGPTKGINFAVELEDCTK
ncbi:MAG: hypothetical protein IOD12_15795 [Silvanigrellales bacterium]|nr:hypothetical protein [Silvanigrellales bacterium]